MKTKTDKAARLSIDAVVDRLAKLEREIAAERGELSFFAFLRPVGHIDAWDLVISAPWINGEIGATIDYVSMKLDAAFEEQDRYRFLCIAIVDADNPDLQEMIEDFPTNGTVRKLRRGEYFQQDMERGYIFVARPYEEVAAPG